MFDFSGVVYYTLQINESGFSISNISNPVEISIGRTTLDLAEYLYEETPIIRFVNGSWLEGNEYADYVFTGSAFDREKIITWDWGDVNIRKESQGLEKIEESIQFKTIQRLLTDEYNVVFDDDNAGEAADIVTVKVDDDDQVINIELYHLKYSHGDNPGGRIADLYEVCGQAQKSIFWKGKGGYKFFKHLISREAKRISAGTTSRFETDGGIPLLEIIKAKSKRNYSCSFKIYIVQPGLSKSRASEEQLELLAVTKNHLMETYNIELDVIASH